MGHMGDKKERIGGGGEVFTEADLEAGPQKFDGVEVGRVGGEEEQLAPGGGDQRGRGGRLMEPRVIQHDAAAFGQFG